LIVVYTEDVKIQLMANEPVRTTACGPLILATIIVVHLAIGRPLVVEANSTYQSLPYSQNWANTGLITTNDNWSAVPGIEGYRGDGLTSSEGVDPQTVLSFDGGSPIIDVIANQTAPDTLATGGVAEFHLTNSVVALQGSGTADAPFILLYINSAGFSRVRLRYNVRDLDASPDNSVQQMALQYRLGNSGSFVNVPAGYVADATVANSASMVTPIDVSDPAWIDQPQIQFRVITTNAAGSDEWVGIDDIEVSIGLPTLPGDYNHDFSVDAADYVVWRKIGDTQDGYNTWRSHFGQPPASSAENSANATVPEPATAALLIFPAASWCLRRRRAA
jgi:hypothetical protein